FLGRQIGSGEVRHGVRGFDKLLERGHDRGARKEFAKNIDFAAQIFVRYGLDELFCSRARDAVKLHDLRGGGSCDTKRLTFRRKLRHQPHGLRSRSVDAPSGQKKIADKRISQVPLQAWNAAEAWNQAEAQLGKRKTRHLVGHNNVAGKREFEATAE